MKMELVYASTRDAQERVTASQVILRGLANDGGLFVPDHIPTLDKSLSELAGMRLPVRCCCVCCDKLLPFPLLRVYV